ncbi:MAG: hypothetical protein A2283_11500, partial [Lentisphaerae bacterium RIFOXYA12_FULL_48_11]
MKKPFQVAVCVDATKTLGRSVFQGVVAYIRKSGCEWFLHGSAGNRLRLSETIDDLPLKELDGIISFASNEVAIKKIKKAGARFVCIFDEFPDVSVCSVFSDDAAIGHLAANHFLDLQLKKFVYYGTDLARNSETRFRGFKEGIGRAPRRFGTPGSLAMPLHIKAGMEELIPDSPDARRKSLLKLGKSLLDFSNGGRDSIGIFAYSDNMGIMVIEACREVGLAVPYRVAVIAVTSDEIVCELSVPSLTTVQQDARRIGWESAAMLDLLMKGAKPEKNAIAVPPTGIKVRQSTDIVACDDPYVERAVRLIRERFRDKLNVDDLCRVLKISRRTFEDRFRKATGRAPYEEIIRTRIRHAETLLAETSETNLSVAIASGFANERRFEENFRKING